jgi:N-formylglutamate deformylase
VIEVKQRIDRFHRPYLQELEQLAVRARAEFGTMWHLNCHSMRSHGRRRGEKIPRADFVLGDRDGSSCAPEFTRMVRDLLQDLGYRVALNDPFKGAELVTRIGRPQDGRHSLQIEVNRGLYMDEDRIEKSDDFERLKTDMDRLVAGIAAFVRGQLPGSH